MSHVDFVSSQFSGYSVSPAESLDFVIGYDGEGWPIYRTFSVRDIVVSPSGRTYRIAGFTRQNTILAYPHGLDRDPLACGYELKPEGMEHVDFAPTGGVASHRDGLVTFAG